VLIADPMFHNTLSDLIRGIRANKHNEKKYIASRMDEIRSELRSTDMELKANAVCKLTYVSHIYWKRDSSFIESYN
jgi:AP-3 complex subunit delta-1